MTPDGPLAHLDGTEQVRDKYRGALLGTAVGDGLGAPFEGHRGRVPLPRIAVVELDHRPLRHTDDTAMTIAVAQSLLRAGRLDQDHLAATFARNWEREPGRGYGPGTAALLAHLAAGGSWREAASAQYGGRGSFGNGAAMRVAPVALWAAGDPVLAAEVARRSAVVTHTHPLAVDGAAVQAAAVALALAQLPDDGLDGLAFLAELRALTAEPALAGQLELVGSLLEDGDVADEASQLGTGVEAHVSVAAAIYSFLGHPDSFSHTIRSAIRLGGDTDTIAAMAGAIAGARLGAHAIASTWLERTQAAPALSQLVDQLVSGTAGTQPPS